MPEADVDHIYDYPKGYIEDILKSVRTIAMVGASGDKTKFSYGVLRVLHETGYQMLPVNPNPSIKEIRGLKVFHSLKEIDKPVDMVVKVSGAQWYWNYEYPDEEISFDSYIIAESDLKDDQKRMLDVDNPLVVPEGTRIKFLVTGNDVMHSFFVPSLALQVYSIAGRINEIWTEVPVGKKKYYGQCNQICGVNHAYMPIVIQALPKNEYEKWLKEAKVKFANNPINENNKIALLDKKEVKEIK